MDKAMLFLLPVKLKYRASWMSGFRSSREAHSNGQAGFFGIHAVNKQVHGSSRCPAVIYIFK
jgi:hypothetical protein